MMTIYEQCFFGWFTCFFCHLIFNFKLGFLVIWWDFMVIWWDFIGYNDKMEVSYIWGIPQRVGLYWKIRKSQWMMTRGTIFSDKPPLVSGDCTINNGGFKPWTTQVTDDPWRLTWGCPTESEQQNPQLWNVLTCAHCRNQNCFDAETPPSFWVNLITTSLFSLTGIMAYKGNHPQMAQQFRLVKYDFIYPDLCSKKITSCWWNRHGRNLDHQWWIAQQALLIYADPFLAKELLPGLQHWRVGGTQGHMGFWDVEQSPLQWKNRIEKWFNHSLWWFNWILWDFMGFNGD